MNTCLSFGGKLKLLRSVIIAEYGHEPDGVLVEYWEGEIHVTLDGTLQSDQVQEVTGMLDSLGDAWQLMHGLDEDPENPQVVICGI
jgi:hypothetical protein